VEEGFLRGGDGRNGGVARDDGASHGLDVGLVQNSWAVRDVLIDIIVIIIIILKY
jgi:hypothetical protein